MNFLRNYKWIVVGAVLGALLGYAYYMFIGCRSGTCMITSKPLNSTIYGLILGGMIGFEIQTKRKPKKNN